MLHYKKGMTLIELLIVVAIIGIIAAIAVPNLLQSIQRSKFNRTLSDMRAIATALGSYYVDNNIYPFQDDLVNLVGIDQVLPVKYYQGASYDAWGFPIYYYSSSDRQIYYIGSYGTNRIWNYPKTGQDETIPWTFRSDTCRKIPYETLGEIIEEGCDIIYANGQLAGTEP